MRHSRRGRESSMREQPRLAACGPARLAPTPITHASGVAATVEEDDVVLLLRVASRSAIVPVAEGLPARRVVLAQDVEVGRKCLLVEEVGVEGAAPSRTLSRARSSRRARSASQRGDAHPATAKSMRRLIRRCVNPADIFTKILSRQLFERHRRSILNLSADAGDPTASDGPASVGGVGG